MERRRPRKGGLIGRQCLPTAAKVRVANVPGLAAYVTQGASTVACSPFCDGTVTGAGPRGLKTRLCQSLRRANFEVPACDQPLDVWQLRECLTDSAPDQRYSKKLA